MELYCSLHHVGIAVNDPEEKKEIYQLLGFDCGETQWDQSRHVNLSLCTHHGCAAEELISPADENSPVIEVLSTKGEGPYHLCFLVNSIAGLISRLDQEDLDYDLISEKEPAILFKEKPVQFLFVEDVGMVELLEDKDYTGDSQLEATHEKESCISLISPDFDNARAFFEILGYQALDQVNDVHNSNQLIILGKENESKIQLIIPTGSTSPEAGLLKRIGPTVYKVYCRVPDLTGFLGELEKNGREFDWVEESQKNGILREASQGIYITSFPSHIYWE